MRHLISNHSAYRRIAAVLMGVIVASGSAACAHIPIQAPVSDAEMRIRQATDALVALQREEPALPGFSFGDSIAANALSRRSRDDADLLIARLYYELTLHLQGDSRDQRTNRTGLRALLATPRPVGPLTSGYYNDLLADTRSRSASDAEFARSIRNASTASRIIWNNGWNDYKCIIDGMPWPMIACRTLLLHGEFASADIIAPGRWPE